MTPPDPKPKPRPGEQPTPAELRDWLFGVSNALETLAACYEVNLTIASARIALMQIRGLAGMIREVAGGVGI